MVKNAFAMELNKDASKTECQACSIEFSPNNEHFAAVHTIVDELIKTVKATKSSDEKKEQKRFESKLALYDLITAIEHSDYNILAPNTRAILKPLIKKAQIKLDITHALQAPAGQILMQEITATLNNH
jgi:hypothetical protein